ncbi:probable E3 ubiquitin-protein ligase ARI7 [Papaver somniferum]|uniref:probable E3 ubiquitin-protein ligase ARI7 n=1 Tax=Papaver somniferum TaxID=3469 RepID=UPI000E6F6958|nr:probable E3 ubiquitin-protein ligase ARI7 [Papaver somniferum]
MDSKDEYLSSNSDVEEEFDDADCGDDHIDFDDEQDGEFEIYDEEDREFEIDDDSDETGGKEICYTNLKEEDVCKRQVEAITQTSTRLSIPTVSATMLLLYHNWDVDKAQDAWFADEDKGRKDIGLQEVVPIKNTKNIIMCTICFDEFGRDGMCATTCGHLFCKLCWTQYVSIKIIDGPGCLRLRCPEPSCGVAVGQDMVNELVSDEDKEKYSRYLLRSYVEDQKNIKWCPSPDCEFLVEFVAGSSSYDVVCGSDHSFCWNCLDDAHRPVDCDTVHKWALQNNSESENVTWILANSKSCPKCKKPIQKNEGCMHMTCRCKFQFCWLCLGDWSTHGDHTGGNYACNVYEKAKSKGHYKEEDKLKKEAKDYLDRYTFYYERFAENQKSRLNAARSLQKTKSNDFAMLSDRYRMTDMNLEAITDAWLQIIECRRVLKWTYAYGYYLPQSEYAKKIFFQYLQGEAESALERLHQCAEQEIQLYLKDDLPEDFFSFHVKLDGLTVTTKNYFDNLVRALENGLSEVDSEAAARQPAHFEESCQSKRKRGTKRK